mmetsp:Transcript_78979/g.139409  ORF Transcript_78979/g.139409 Transcript_78979/m.139409 type:complete len:268 (-) Transcript_78979:115-918(-)
MAAQRTGVNLANFWKRKRSCETWADPTDLAGSWSESERVLQRKNNCYRFNLVAELVGADGSGLEKMKAEAKLKGLWILGESLQLKDRTAPQASGKQLHFVGRCTEEVNARLFRDLLERELEVIHKKIGTRMEKRKQKESGTAPEADAGKAEGVKPLNGQDHGAWQQPPPANFWGGAPGGYGGYQAYPGAPSATAATGAAWAAPPVSVFEQDASAPGTKDGEEKGKRSRSRRRRHRHGNGTEGGEGKEKRRRSGSRKRRRRGGEGAEG